MDENKQEKRIAELEAQIAEGSEILAKGFSTDQLAELDALSDELDGIKRRRDHEAVVKEDYWRKFESGFGSREDFDHLWRTRLRYEAMLDGADVGSVIRRASEHGLYSDF